MIRRTFLALAASAAALSFAGAASADTIKIGASAPKSGPLAGGAAMTHWPNVHMWVEEVNERGGLQVGDQQMQIELIEYDDQTSAETAIQNIQRLATQDEVDFLITPYSTGINVATAPMIAQYGYPHITTSAATDGVAEFAERWPNSFWMLGTATQLAEGAVQTLVKLRDNGDIGDTVALVHVADAFGLELVNAAKGELEEAGFEIVYEASYPLGTQDVAPIISGAAAANPDAFVAFSYPGDTFALTEQAQIQGLEVGAFYTGVGTAFPPFAGRFGAAAEGRARHRAASTSTIRRSPTTSSAIRPPPVPVPITGRAPRPMPVCRFSSRPSRLQARWTGPKSSRRSSRAPSIPSSERSPSRTTSTRTSTRRASGVTASSWLSPRTGWKSPPSRSARKAGTDSPSTVSRNPPARSPAPASRLGNRVKT
jgi:branched-chain amino acid transport system substrate-binding protein